MIKKTLYFGNPAYLCFNNGQLVLRLPEVEKNDSVPTAFKQKAERTIPVEDIGVLLLDHRQITITHALLAALLDNNCAVITCDDSHLPTGLMLPLCGNATQSERFRDQIEASLAETTVATNRTGQNRQPSHSTAPPRSRKPQYVEVGKRGTQRRCRQYGSPGGRLLLGQPLPRDTLLPAQTRRCTAQQPAQLRLRHSARRRGPGSRNQRAAAHVGHSPPQPLQRLLPRRRHHGTVPSLRRPYGVRTAR